MGLHDFGQLSNQGFRREDVSNQAHSSSTLQETTDGNRRFLLICFMRLTGKQASSLSKNKLSLLHSRPLLSFHIWSLFSIMTTGAPAMTPLAKMPIRPGLLRRLRGINSPTRISECNCFDPAGDDLCVHQPTPFWLLGNSEVDQGSGLRVLVNSSCCKNQGSQADRQAGTDTEELRL
ncbi:unnamed protein product [Pleuronectes platessa]|uniref:Uncharacterized protein n=1 Tax=Pleuronectes platessa TaxID=8262 RepID=A0A9N7VUX0_PLEPL|nr:unnamed protein product [Pleuronectes platessa]